MINAINLQRLRNGEYSQFIRDTLNIILENDPAGMQVETQFNALYEIAAAIELLFKVPTGSAITAELINLDEQRGSALKGILAIVRGNMFNDDPVVKQYAIVLDTHLALFGKNIYNDNYQSETNTIRNIIADWNSKPELVVAISGLGLQNWQDTLENANNGFGEKYLQRAVELGSDATESIKEKRLEANAAYYALRDNINARYTITNAGEPYKTVVASVNGLISYYNDLLSRRIGGAKDEDSNVVDATAA